jgi:hypothetical protein
LPVESRGSNLGPLIPLLGFFFAPKIFEHRSVRIEQVWAPRECFRRVKLRYLELCERRIKLPEVEPRTRHSNCKLNLHLHEQRFARNRSPELQRSVRSAQPPLAVYHQRKLIIPPRNPTVSSKLTQRQRKIAHVIGRDGQRFSNYGNTPSATSSRCRVQVGKRRIRFDKAGHHSKVTGNLFGVLFTQSFELGARHPIKVLGLHRFGYRGVIMPRSHRLGAKRITIFDLLRRTPLVARAGAPTAIGCTTTDTAMGSAVSSIAGPIGPGPIRTGPIRVWAIGTRSIRTRSSRVWAIGAGPIITWSTRSWATRVGTVETGAIRVWARFARVSGWVGFGAGPVSTIEFRSWTPAGCWRAAACRTPVVGSRAVWLPARSSIVVRSSVPVTEFRHAVLPMKM